MSAKSPGLSSLSFFVQLPSILRVPCIRMKIKMQKSSAHCLEGKGYTGGGARRRTQQATERLSVLSGTQTRRESPWEGGAARGGGGPPRGATKRPGAPPAPAAEVPAAAGFPLRAAPGSALSALSAPHLPAAPGSGISQPCPAGRPSVRLSVGPGARPRAAGLDGRAQAARTSSGPAAHAGPGLCLRRSVTEGAGEAGGSGGCGPGSGPARAGRDCLRPLQKGRDRAVPAGRRRSQRA